MLDLKKIIQPVGGFQYSVNIYYDINDDEKIRSYIPSNSSLQIIEDILKSTDSKSTDRARILTGAYGKGKSHLILTTLALLSGREKELFSTILNKAAENNKILYQNLNGYFENKKKLLPVIINANTLDIKAVLLQSLHEALKVQGLSKIMPVTFFDAAIEKILDWKKSFPDTYLAFEKAIGISVGLFIEDLKLYKQSEYERFVKIYPSLTSGSEFNPMANMDVLTVYDGVIEEIKKIGYNGIFIVYDEFGKFLEGSVDGSSAMDIKLIQDLAEKCNRSGEKQLHILLVSHKNIENYIGGLPKTKVDAWKAVSNRFKSITINNNDNEIYDMVATVLKRDKDRFQKFALDNEAAFCKMVDSVKKDHAFENVRKIMGENFVYSCYPLHPYSLLLLPKISELVAQNERTIFTFLSSSERNTVSYFLSKTEQEFPLIEPDYVYDYFEKLFKGEPYGSEIKKQWQIAESALAKIKDTENELAEKIIKTIALIYCVNEFEIIPPSWDIIESIYDVNYSGLEINAAKELLKTNNVLIELLYKPYVRLSENSGHNVIELISQEKYKIENKVDIKKVLNGVASVKYLYPMQYNDDNEIVRYFDFQFISKTELSSIAKDGFLIPSSADGVVYALYVKDDDELEEINKFVKQNHNSRIVFIIPKKGKDLKDFCIEYMAIQNLIEIYKNKEIQLVDELNYILEDRYALLSAYVDNTYLKAENAYSNYFYKGVQVDIRRKAQLSQLLSSIMEKIYFNTPKIVNELINKNNISSAIKVARQKIFSGLLSGNYKKDLDIKGNGPELNILKAVLIAPGIFINDEEARLEVKNIDPKFSKLLEEIRSFILTTAQDKREIGELYSILMNPENGYGLKKGIISIYILVVILSYFKGHIVISKKGREIPLNAALFNELESEPENYNIYLESWDQSKEAYIANLENVFGQYINSSDKIGGSFSYITKAMRRWFLQLSRFECITKNCCDDKKAVSNIDKATLKFRSILNNPEINSHELLFEQLPKCYGSDDLAKIVLGVRKSFNILNKNLTNFKNYFIYNIGLLFEIKGQEKLGSALHNYYDDLKSTTKEHSFSGKTAAFISIANNPNNDENKLVEDLARAICNLRIGDFTDEMMAGFLDEIKGIKSIVDDYDSKSDSIVSGNNGYKISFVDVDGNETTKQFDSVEETQNAKYLYNDILSTINDEYGDSLSVEEKRQVLFKILKDLD